MDKSTDLYKIRHSLAHVMAQAVLQLRPGAKLAFGPPIDTGCYYDFDLPEPLSSDDFSEIEKRMRKIIGGRQQFEHRFLAAAEAVKYLKERDEQYKVEYCEELIGKGNSEIGFYKNGPFEDMCEGPHVTHTGEIPADAFKIDSVAGAYWRGSEKNPQLTRLYCLAFENKAQLQDYVAKRKLAEEREHRKLGKELELYMFADQVGPGLALWMPNGTVIREELEALAKETEARAGYQRVATPHIAREELYLKSGHLPYYADTMFPPMELEGEPKYYLKAMNCPHHHLIYGNRPRSYRELPYRLAEYGTCYRFEPSGTLSGLLRVRSLCMNDAHIYCSLEQLKVELKATIQMCLNYFAKFRFEGVQLRVSTHDPANTEKFLDNPTAWEFCERFLEEAITELKVPYVIGKGEAAFYGPKIDFQVRTILGKEETLTTSQLDFAGAERFDLNYIGEDGKEHRPYIIHRAPLGTHERFIAFLIEHFGGAFPTWMAPVQARIIAVGPSVAEYAQGLEAKLLEKMLRVDTDNSANSFNKKIREAVTAKIPNILIVGDKEKEQGTVTLRRYCVKEQLTLSQAELLDRFERLVSERMMDNFPEVG